MTPLRRWQKRTGQKWADLARKAGVSERCVRRAAAGTPIGALAARAIAYACGLRLEDFALIDPDLGREGMARELATKRRRL